jgi:FtsZ-binding cell division protein ZapB
MNVKKLVNLKEVLNALDQVETLYRNITKHKDKITSTLLNSLIQYTDNGGMVPVFSDKVKTFKGIIDWSKLGKGMEDEQLPEPNGGVDEEYDEAKEAIKTIKEKLNSELKKWQEFFSDKGICYVHKKEVYYTISNRDMSWR